MTAYIQNETDLPQPDNYDPMMHFREPPMAICQCDIPAFEVGPCVNCGGLFPAEFSAEHKEVKP